MTLIHQLRRRFSQRSRRVPEPIGESARDQLYSTRLRAGGAARLPPAADRVGYIGPEPQLRVPFELAAGDREIKVVVFSDPPGLLSLAVESPDGRLLTAESAAHHGASMLQHEAMASCSFRLPLLGDSVAATTSGRWQVVLSVDTRRFKEYLMKVRGRFPREFERLAASGVYYNISVLAARGRAVAALPAPPARAAGRLMLADRPGLVLPLP